MTAYIFNRKYGYNATDIATSLHFETGKSIEVTVLHGILQPCTGRRIGMHEIVKEAVKFKIVYDTLKPDLA